MMRLKTRTENKKRSRQKISSKKSSQVWLLLRSAWFGIIGTELLAARLSIVDVAGTPHYDLAGKALGMQAVWTKTGQKVELRSKWTTLKFEVDAKILY